MEQYYELVSVPAIATVVYWVMNLIKYTTGNKESFKRFIPLLSALMGVVFGIVCYLALPSLIPAKNVVMAMVLGGASGLTATGANQIIKQLAKEDEEKLNETDGDDSVK